MSSPARAARRRPWSLQRRLLLGIVALLALLSIVVGSASVLVLQQNLMVRLDQQVRASLGFEGGQGGPIGGDTGPQRRVGSLVVLLVDEEVRVAAYTADDGTIVQPSVEQLAALEGVAVDGRPTTVELGGDLGAFRVAAREDVERGVVVISGQSLAEVRATTGSLILIFALVAVAALAVAVLAGQLVVRLALRPLDRVAATATRVAELPLATGEVALRERVPERDADPATEVGQVGAAFNRMLGHVELSLRARQESEDTLRRFVADASHELRTPLASIRGYSELAQRIEGELPPDVARSLDRIGSESVRMTGLVEDLLLLARLDAGDRLRREEVELAPILLDAVGDAHAAGPEHVWELDLAEDAADLVAVGDPGRLTQVVVNLLANARAHTPPGTTVTAGLSREGDAAVLRVADDGPGIPEALRPRLFERFVRGDDSRSRAAGSSGLGLSIVAAIAEAHGGVVAVDSRPGATVFTVRLPLA
ncbi:sensor histidine kinase [Homoserinibacter sp. YIM 151385]|uniref:sensor histidine kinase n=1 Tax=Homoserinibacter sp. YIM 151385 TaxID=2985506 RepID=UPI0022EFDB9D|nr:HAMP domain-containing sensor histidine kinase [Homoserinibacter sp. YIM 151385]WBU39099.1 HAMP domain-containing sensor histidine kinase [Homoserinibacter sp. YIM 151385]